MDLIIFPVLAGIAALLFAWYLARNIMKQGYGTKKMKAISEAIQEGAMAFLHREFKSLLIFAIVVAAVLYVFIGAYNSLTFVLGIIASAMAGYIGMSIATNANVRTANASKTSSSKALKIAFSGGAVMGFCVVGLGLFVLSILFIIFPEPEILLGYAFGASSVALFMRVGGGIYTKSADVGADLVGKVEKSIPEDDPRNPAVIADNVGDNVGDVAGMGADLFESYVDSMIAAMVIGIFVYGTNGMLLPLVLGATGIVVSIIGTFFVWSSKEGKGFEEQTDNARKALNKGVQVSAVLMVVAGYFVVTNIINDIGIFYAVVAGLVSGFLIGKSTEYYTSKSPVIKIAESSQTGAATNIIEGFSNGLMSTAVPIIIISIATLVAYHFAGLYGIAIAAVGILVTLGMLLSIDCYGPIVDNAAGIAQMAGMGKNVRARAEALDSVGNTTAAIGKGFAISSAALAALAWLAAYFHTAEIDVISITDPNVIVGLFIGSALSFIFCALTMRSVGRGAFQVVNEVRKQFKEIKGLMRNRAKPDYTRCVDITTRKAIHEMILPGVLVIVIPIIVGIVLGVNALGGLLAGALITGFLLAITMANAGGAWDNAKKYIEAGNLGGKGSNAHKASVVGDTVGDPFKDTAGPSLNILIKLIGKVAIIFVPVIMVYALV